MTSDQQPHIDDTIDPSGAVEADAAGAPSGLMEPPGVLFTAFEPSGDDHAALVIRELRRRHANLPIFAWGGPKMRRAGAEIIAETGADAVMGVPGLAKIREHQRINRDIARWMDNNPGVSVHVPVDSPAANFPVCAMAKKRGIKVVHLVAPQVWAWGSWRVAKLRRLTDLVLCVLPFEEAYFADHDVPARFIGHPLFDEPLDLASLDDRAHDLPGGEPRLAILPISRRPPAARTWCSSTPHPGTIPGIRRTRCSSPSLCSSP